MSLEAIETTTRSRRHLAPIAIVVVVLVAIVWFLWPAVTGQHGDVALITDAPYSAVVRDVTSEVRIRGRDLIDGGEVADWCALATRAADVALPAGVHFVVLAITDRGSCTGDPEAAAVRAFEHRSVDPVIVVPPGQRAPALDVRTVPVEQLLGAPGVTTQSCQWWDSCPPYGTVVVRTPDGALAPAGANRVARMVAATIG